MQIAALDIGGTHARFALADIAEGRVMTLSEAITLKTAEHASLQTAWEEFCHQLPQPRPRAAAIAIACPIRGEVLKLTNNPWIIRPALINEKLGLDRHVLVNDFEAVGHTVATAEDTYLLPLCGPAGPLPRTGICSIIGPGTGLGVAQVLYGSAGYQVQPSEGGHADFAPLDTIEDNLLARLRRRYRRVSVERVVSGPGIVDIYETLASIEGRAIQQLDDRSIWTQGLQNTDNLATAAIDRFCMSLGAVAGDIALVQGASSVVIAGGLGYRIRDVLLRSGFADRFRAKGRFEGMMASLPVRLITHPQPGLFGAAAAFAREHAA